MLRRIFVVLLALVLVFAVGVSYAGILQVPLLSAAFGMDRGRDLKMPADRAAFVAFADKWGIERPSAGDNYTLSSRHHFSGSVEIDDTISEAALGAMREVTQPNSHLRDIQFRIHEGYAEMAAFVTVPGYPISGPVYGQIAINRVGPNRVSIDVRTLEFGRLGVPGDVVKQVEDTVGTYLNEKIVEAGIRIDMLELKEGGIHFKGAWPKRITADPSAPNAIP